VKWYQKAADQGNASAQFNLGHMYYDGKGVTKNYVKVHMWWNIAGASGNSFAVEGRNTVAKQMTSSQLQEAQKLASEWMSRHE
jgi:hypothetical protein